MKYEKGALQNNGIDTNIVQITMGASTDYVKVIITT